MKERKSWLLYNTMEYHYYNSLHVSSTLLHHHYHSHFLHVCSSIALARDAVVNSQLFSVSLRLPYSSHHLSFSSLANLVPCAVHGACTKMLNGISLFVVKCEASRND